MLLSFFLMKFLRSFADFFFAEFCVVLLSFAEFFRFAHVCGVLLTFFLRSFAEFC